jgi:hypothetical protein
MRLGGVALSATTGVLAAALAGCGVFGLGSPEPVDTTPSAPPAGDSWLVIQEGRAVPSATPTGGRRSPTPDVTLPLGTRDPSCPHDWSGGSVMIPVTVTAGPRSLTATWPRQRQSTYNVAAVPQKLVGGVQPPVTWQPVAAATSGCTVTATIRGLLRGQAYIVWLDAPNPGFDRDGTRYPYSGRSGVVYPR